MKKINIKIKKEGGYAILFTLVVISIISMISMGLANTALKQIVLSGVARDSTTAFYEADLGSECVMYADHNDLFPGDTSSLVTFNCGGDSYSLKATAIGLTSTYTMLPNDTLSASNNKCFRITDMTKDNNQGPYTVTTIVIDGYNICNTTNMRTVQRSIRIKY